MQTDPMASAEPPILNAPRPDRAERVITLLGWVATVSAVLMYISYVSQIRLNLAGHKGAVIQPLATVVNCSLRVDPFGLLNSLARPFTFATQEDRS